MTETTNFGLYKPDLTDPVDVQVFNENFEKVDENLGKFYDIFKDGDFQPDFDLSENEKTIDVTEYLNFADIYAAVKEKKFLRLWYKRTDSKTVCTALLSDVYDTAGGTVYFCGLSSMPYYNASYAEFVLSYSRTDETFTLHHYGNFPQRFLNNVKGQVVQTVNGVAPDEDGNVEVATTSEAKVTAGHTVINGNTYTMTLTLDDGSTSVNVVEVTDGLPTKITVDGVEIPWTWEEVTADG